MTTPMDTWAALLKRLGHPDKKDPHHEWFMALDDRVGKLAWCAWAEPLDARYVATKGAEGVAWDFPVVPRMKRALALAEAEFSADQLKRRQENLLLARVVADLRSYRDTGYSLKSVEKPGAPEPKKRKVKGRAALARKAAR